MLGSLSYSEKLELESLLAERAHRKKVNRLKGYEPYPKQIEFHNAGASYRERLFAAGNQLGKTLSGAAEVAMHLTGEYPFWWQGLRFDHPIVVIAGSESGELTRDGVQRLLVGQPDREEEWGTGFIPKRCIQRTTRRQGVSNATKGSVMMTYTPLKGMSAVSARFFLEDAPDRIKIMMTIQDALHYSQEERDRIIASYPAHEREARTKGIPTLGSGLIFPVMEEDIVVQPFPIPPHWVQIGGIDFGWDHPTAAASLAWDRDSDIVYVTRDYRKREATPLIHAAALKPWGAWLPWSWPHDGLQHDKGSGEQIAKQYKEQGMKMLPQRAQFLDGSNGVEAGLSDMLLRMQTGRWKVFSTCQDWLQERQTYHRKDGKVVKERDDVISASRYALMMLRFAKQAPPPETSRAYRGFGANTGSSWMSG
ncbi:terminase family protein [Pseudochrobactrum sp. B5]|uniref:phage terminase large subunit family protein n=1 Tax=Pseudochrobactrum sp. B5 TaxID=1289478 RepID=UPI0009F9BFA4|nr:terminase family protein [Pseudochrobactrum sp. B5]